MKNKIEKEIFSEKRVLGIPTVKLSYWTTCSVLGLRKLAYGRNFVFVQAVGCFERSLNSSSSNFRRNSSVTSTRMGVPPSLVVTDKHCEAHRSI